MMLRTSRRIAAAAALLALVAIVALGRSAGADPVLRTVRVGADPVAVALDQRAGRAFVLTDDGVSVLDTRTGALLRTVAVGGGANALAVDEHGGRLFVASTDAAGPTGSPIGTGSVSVLNARDGALLRSTGVAVTPSALGVDERRGQLFVTGGSAPNATGSRDVLLLASRSLAMLRGVSAGMSSGALTGLFASAVAIDELSGHAIVASADGSVSVLDLRGARVLRTSALSAVCPGVYHFPVAVAVDQRGGRAFVADHEGGCVGVLDRRGAFVRGVAVGGHPLGLAVDEASGRVFVADAAGSAVSMLDARGGRLLRAIHVGSNPHALVVDARTNRVYVANQGGGVSVLDASSGALLRTIPVAGHPLYIAVDERAGRVFVVSGGGGASRPDPWGWLPAWLRTRLPWLPGRPASPRLTTGSVTVLDAAR